MYEQIDIWGCFFLHSLPVYNHWQYQTVKGQALLAKGIVTISCQFIYTFLSGTTEAHNAVFKLVRTADRSFVINFGALSMDHQYFFHSVRQVKLDITSQALGWPTVLTETIRSCTTLGWETSTYRCSTDLWGHHGAQQDSNRGWNGGLSSSVMSHVFVSDAMIARGLSWDHMGNAVKSPLQWNVTPVLIPGLWCGVE